MFDGETNTLWGWISFQVPTRSVCPPVLMYLSLQFIKTSVLFFKRQHWLLSCVIYHFSLGHGLLLKADEVQPWMLTHLSASPSCVSPARDSLVLLSSRQRHWGKSRYKKRCKRAFRRNLERGGLQSHLLGVSLLSSKEKLISQKILSFSQKVVSGTEI